MVITKFPQPGFNRVVQEEPIDTKFANFGEHLVTAFSRFNKTCRNAYTSYGSDRRFISLVLEKQSF